MIAATAMRASGQQKFGAKLTFVAYFVFGIPLALVLISLFELENAGLWCGPMIACAFNTAAYLIIFKRMDWPSLIEKQAL